LLALQKKKVDQIVLKDWSQRAREKDHVEINPRPDEAPNHFNNVAIIPESRARRKMRSQMTKSALDAL
jgi:hypothetical protein